MTLFPMPKYRISVVLVPVEVSPSTAPASCSASACTSNSSEVFFQIVDDLDLPSFIRSVNPQTRKRRGKKEVQS